ncbi:MAG: DUF3800 domain-containing protein [Pseudomonadota bacterium]
MRFSVFIDESGDIGVSRVRTSESSGSSPYFVMGAAVLQPAGCRRANSILEKAKDRIGKSKWKHATDLDHNAKVFLCRELTSANLRLFGVISNKATLKGYKEEINWDPQKFYNKCLQYLLELICSYLSRFDIGQDDISFVLEQRNHDYDRMLRYLQRVKDNPLYGQSEALTLLNPFGIVRRRKGEEQLLEVADLVSHALYQLTNKTKSNYDIPEPRYFDELQSRFGCDKRGMILGTGIKCIHSLEQLELDEDIAMRIRAARAKPAQ